MEKKTRKFFILGIKWDKDDRRTKLNDQMRIEVTSDEVEDIEDFEEVEERISDKLSDETGFCHDGWAKTIEYGDDEAFLPYRAIKTSHIIKSQCYVTANNDVMSGWGEAVGKTARCIVPCPSPEIAKQVVEKFQQMGGFSRIRVCMTPPKVNTTTQTATVFDYRPYTTTVNVQY